MRLVTFAYLIVSGLVTIKDRPWDILVQKMTEVNAGLEARHARSAAKPTE
jgi:hypothetical protein